MRKHIAWYLKGFPVGPERPSPPRHGSQPRASSTSCCPSSTPTSRSRPRPTARAGARARPAGSCCPEHWLDDPDDATVPARRRGGALRRLSIRPRSGAHGPSPQDVTSDPPTRAPGRWCDRRSTEGAARRARGTRGLPTPRRRWEMPVTAHRRDGDPDARRGVTRRVWTRHAARAGCTRRPPKGSRRTVTTRRPTEHLRAAVRLLHRCPPGRRPRTSSTACAASTPRRASRAAATA